MVKKRKYRLKKRVKLILVIFLVICVSLFAYNRYKVYKYHQTDEYKLLRVGYTNEETATIMEKLDTQKREDLIASAKKDYLVDLLTSKYFLMKNYERYITFSEKNSDKTISDVVAMVNVNADREWYSDTKITDTTNKYEIFVNKFYLLPEEYTVENIKTFSSTYAYGTVKAEEGCYKAFKKMADAARKEEIVLVLSSGYRSHESQENTYREIELTKGEEYADSYAARPYSSEHETGLALDILSNGKYIYTDTFEESPAFLWLQNHAHEYGFILRYPKDKEYLTGYTYESWHYRYVGEELATKIKEEGITFDEYYAYYLEK